MADCPINNESLTGADPTQLTGSSPLLNNDTKGITSGVGSGATSMFDVNKMISPTQHYLAINSIVNEMIGYEFKWFRAVPQQRSKDVIFQEYTLSNVEECPLDVKAVIPNGNMPDSKYNYDLMGLEYEIPFEIQIDKKYWESIAGFGTAPQKKDIVYFPMANKLYQVESSHLFRGFMEQETAWKINLIKYQPEASRREKDALKETIDIYTVSTEEIFGGAIEKDVKKLTNDTQFSQFNATSQDKYKYFDPSLNTINQAINIYGTILAQSFYDLQSSSWYNAITYKTDDRISQTDNRAVTAWIKPRTIPSIHKEYNVLNIEPISLGAEDMYDIDASLFNAANYSITLSSPASLSDIQLDATVVISRPGALNFYGKVVGISVNPLQYHIAINPFVLEDLEEIRTDWASQTNYKLTIKEPISIIDGVNDFGKHLFSVNVYANQYIAISYGHTYCDSLEEYNAYVLRLDDKLNDDEWYGIVVNMGNSWGQYNVNVWKRHDTDKFAKLRQIFYETLRLYPEDIYVNNYTVNKSPAYLTNLRLFSTTIEEERQSNELLSYFSKDGDQLIIGDNADPITRQPYVTKQR